MDRNHKLQRTYFLNVIIVNLISITFLGSIWILHEYLQYNDEIKVLKENFIDNQKITIKNEVENAINYIDNINKDTEKELKNSLQIRMSEISQIIQSVYSNQTGQTHIHTEETIKDLLRKLNNYNKKSNIFIIAHNKIDNLQISENEQSFLPYDTNNRTIIKEKSTVALNSGEGWFRHSWFSPNNKKQSELVSYVKHFEELDWIVGIVIDYDEFISSRQYDVILRLSHVRFGKNRDGYLFANVQNADPLFTNGIITIGEPNKWNLKDPYGVRIMQEQNKAAQKPEGDYIYYSWRKIFTQEEKAYGIEKPTSKKISYIKGYKPWNWMIGAGFYFDDIDLAIAQKREVLHQVVGNHILIISIALLFSILVSLAFIKFIYNKIKFNFSRFTSFFNEAAAGKAKLEFDTLYYQEFKELALYANKMVEQRELAEHGFRQIVEVFPFPICIYKNNHVLYLNPQWISVVGYNTVEIPTLSRAMVKCFKDIEERRFLQTLKNGDSISISDKHDTLFKVSCKDGQIRYMKLNYIEMKSRSMLTLEDYSYRKKVEDEINAARIKAEESDKLKTAFLANMSHEIRTPMNAIIGFSGLLQKDNISEEKRSQYLTYILKSSDSLLNLINDILDISKIEAGELNFKLAKASLESTFSSVEAEIKSIRSTMNKQHIDIISKYDLKEDLSIIETDFLRLKQILLNLLSNALKFTHHGSIEFGCVKQKDYIQFSVKDTGIGLKPDHIKKIFNRFTKIEDDNSQLFRGAGLGLSISKKIVEALGGQIWVESQFGVGSSFYFTLPIHQNTTNIIRKLDRSIN